MTIQSQLDQVLAPCPFCGGEAVFLPYKKDGLTLRCSSFGCVRRDQRAGIRLSIDQLRERMAADWNHRTAVGGEAVAWVSSEAASLLRKLPSCAAAFRSFDVNAASVKRDDRSVPIYLQPPATVDVGAGKEALAIIDKWMESYDHMGTGTSAVARMSEREWEEDRAKLAALIGKEA